MDVFEIIDGINAKKVASNITNQQIADISGEPKSSVDRILRKDTQNPSLRAILKIAAAVDYDFGKPQSEPAGQFNDPYVRHIIAMYEKQIRDLKKEHNRERAEKNRRISNLSLILGIVCSGFVFIYLADITNPDAGWFRGHSADFAILFSAAVVIVFVFVFLTLHKKQIQNEKVYDEDGQD